MSSEEKDLTDPDSSSKSKVVHSVKRETAKLMNEIVIIRQTL